MDDILKECNKNLKSFTKINSELSVLNEKLKKNLRSLHLNLGFNEFSSNKNYFYLKIPLKEDKNAYCELRFFIGRDYNEYDIILNRASFIKTTTFKVTDYNSVFKFVKQCYTRKFSTASKILIKECPKLTDILYSFINELKQKLHKVYTLTDQELVKKYKIPECIEYCNTGKKRRVYRSNPNSTHTNQEFLKDLRKCIELYGKPIKFETEEYDNYDEDYMKSCEDREFGFTQGTKLKVFFKENVSINSSNYLEE